MPDEERIEQLELEVKVLRANNKGLKDKIDEQSKEIEELKVNNKKLQDKAKELIYEKQQLTSALLDSTPNDKIKAKIDEVCESTIEESNVDILYSLLEKE